MRIALALVLSTQTALAQPLLRSPVDVSCISSPFGPRHIANHPEAGTFHYGVDLPASEGTPVKATAAGTVLKVQHKALGGLELLIQHPGFVTVYSHLASVSVSVGKTITAGEQVGYVGRTGLTFGPHLYFGMMKNGVPVDPPLSLPRCAGSTAMSPAAILASGGKLPPTRHYAINP